MASVLEPRVQYAVSTDGVNIAYVVFGNESADAVPLICLRPPQLSHMGMEWQLPLETRWHEFELLSRERRVIRFDSRGCGLSDRNVEDISLEARARDIDAVAGRLGLEHFALQGQIHAGSWAIAYAARNPERVSHLILTQAYTNGAEYWGWPPRAALESLASVDWVTYTEASMSNAFSWAPGELPRALAAQMRASVSEADFLHYLAYDKTCDVTELLSEVQCPVLVTQFDLAGVTARAMGQRLAAGAPHGRMFLPRTFPESLSGYAEFLAEALAPDSPAPAEHSGPTSLRTYLVARHAEPAARETIGRHGGTAIEAPDGTRAAIFGSAQAAIACARELALDCGAAAGVHASEGAEPPEGTVDPALVTAVLAVGLAGDGTVVVSNVVRELAAGRGFQFEPLDDELPADEREPIRMYALQLTKDAP